MMFLTWTQAQSSTHTHASYFHFLLFLLSELMPLTSDQTKNKEVRGRLFDADAAAAFVAGATFNTGVTAFCDKSVVGQPSLLYIRNGLARVACCLWGFILESGFFFIKMST